MKWPLTFYFSLLEVLSKNTEKIDSRSPETPEYAAGVINIPPWCSICIHNIGYWLWIGSFSSAPRARYADITDQVPCIWYILSECTNLTYPTKLCCKIIVWSQPDCSRTDFLISTSHWHGRRVRCKACLFIHRTIQEGVPMHRAGSENVLYDRRTYATLTVEILGTTRE